MAKKQKPTEPRLVCVACGAPAPAQVAPCACGSEVFRNDDAALARVRAVRHAEDFLTRCREAKDRCTGDYRRLLALEHQAAYGEPVPDVSLDLIFRKLAYRIQSEGFRQEGLALPEKVRQNQLIAERLSGEGFTYDDVLRAHVRAKESPMAKKTEKTEKRRSIQVACAELFAQKTGNPDAMIKAIKGEFPDSAFKENHVAFYAAKFRKGQLSGQTEGAYTIAWLPGRGAGAPPPPKKAQPPKVEKAKKARKAKKEETGAAA